ncbi:sulfotransferase domain-containing protein [Phaeobacter marinintestinus]|uniref:sulfotransferase domain-containing protein n=1 Tax=Falsiphaeobacter marinintestinus TaxID=1492905 RepID=UPI0011B48356|nr:sulfotransferase domain-containing protein [Phaeobacter marinintestinus]
MARKKTSTRSSKRPNVFVIGPTEGGTSSLHQVLTTHGKISGGREEEINYFSLFHKEKRNWYLDYFKDSETADFYVDASPTYFDMCLNVPTAERIKKFSSKAKIIILIRNPVERAVSHFNHLKNTIKTPALKDINFDDLMARNWDAADTKELETIRERIIAFSRYEQKIEKFVSVFGHDNVIVVHNDDLRAHGAIVVGQIFDFLGLDTPDDVDFSQQRWVHGSEAIGVSEQHYFELIKEFGEDYYRSCKVVDVKRPVAPDGTAEFNQPVGALVGDVAIGADGWLFLSGGSNNVLNMYLEDEADHLAVCARWHAIAQERADRLKAINAQFRQVMIPEKMTVLGDKLGWPIAFDRSRGASFFKTAPAPLRQNIIDAVGYFTTKLKNPERLYLKTDSHWSHVGAFVAYQLICSTMGLKVRADLLSRPTREVDLVLDLGSKLPIPVTEKAQFAKFLSDAKIVNDEGLIRYKRDHNLLNEGKLHVGSKIVFENETAPNDQTVILFGDSFSEYRDNLLTGLMSETFRKVIFVWSTSVDYTLCETVKPDIVLCVMTERFMNLFPNDAFNVEEHAQKRIEDYERRQTS